MSLFSLPPFAPPSPSFSTHPQNLGDCEYNPEDHEESEGDDLPEDWESEPASRTSKTPKKRLLVADAPLTLNQYQNTLKKKIEQLFRHVPSEGEEAEEGEEPGKSQPMSEEWIRVEDR